MLKDAWRGLNNQRGYSALVAGTLAIRIALGATPRGVLRLVFSDAFRLSLIGVAVGMVAAYWLVPLLREHLFGVSPLDGLSFFVAAAGIVAVALVAALLPARRAARVDPIAALRE